MQTMRVSVYKMRGEHNKNGTWEGQENDVSSHDIIGSFSI